MHIFFFSSLITFAFALVLLKMGRRTERCKQVHEILFTNKRLYKEP